ncbi:MAG: UMP kinase [Alkalispirochaeta sp.]
MIVISLGGSILVPDEVDTDLIVAYRHLLSEYTATAGNRAIVVVGGGGPARRYQKAYRAVTERAEAGSEDSEAQDWIGIAATRLNAELLRHSLGSLCRDPVVYDPAGTFSFTGPVLVGAGWKPGFSTDYDAVLLAERFGAEAVVNLSNISQVYTADPKTDPDATPLTTVTWSEFLPLVGDSWKPGSNLPFDPVATAKAAELGLQVIVAHGREIDNTRAILRGETFFGTTIGPE